MGNASSDIPEDENHQVVQLSDHEHSQPPITSLPTIELLRHLEKEFGSILETIQSLLKSENFDQGTRDSIFSLMQDTGKMSQEFYVTKVKVHQVHQAKQNKRQRELRKQNEKQQYKEKVKELYDQNISLKKRNENLEAIITSSSKQRITSGGLTNVGDIRTNTAIAGDQKKVEGKTVAIKENQDFEIKEHLEQQNTSNSKEIDELQRANKNLQSYNNVLKNEIKDMEEKLRHLSEEKNSLMTRLSMMAGQRLLHNNPAIADLSDPNRPTKLGEMYSEIYNNEWTDAFEALVDEGYVEVEAIVTLRLTLINVIEFCRRKSDKLLQKTEEAVNFLFEELKDIEKIKRHLTMTRALSKKFLQEVSLHGFSGVDIDLRDKWKAKDGKKKPVTYTQSLNEVTKPDIAVRQLRMFRKEVAESMVPIIQKAYMAASCWNDSMFIPALKPLIKKCIFFGWMMVVQSPPLALADCNPEDDFDKNLYKEYTSRGPKVDYVVWPALLLHDKGPVIGKGIAQAKKA